MACYGDYYQWGRNFDGHEKRDSNRTTEQALQIDPVQQSVVGMFITGTFEWTVSGLDDNGRSRRSNWSKINGTSVCPIGFRVPAIDELIVETICQGATSNSDIFAGCLKLPSAGLITIVGYKSSRVLTV